MREVINFFTKQWLLFFFIFFEIIVIFFTFSNIKLHKIYGNYSETIIGEVHKLKNNIQNFLLLSQENKKLIEENTILRCKLQNSKIIKNIQDIKKTDIIYLQEYLYLPVKIINNSINYQENYFTIDHGELDGVQVDMGVILPQGIAGIITKTSPHFSIGISLLNTKIKINVRLKKSQYFSTLIWDGIDYNIFILKDIPKHIPITRMELIETDGKSFIFPEGIILGEINDYKFYKGNKTYMIKIKLYENIVTMQNAYVVKNLFKEEIDALKDSYYLNK